MSVALNRSHLLYIGNDPDLSKSTSSLLRAAGYRVRATNPAHAEEAVRDGRYCGVLLCATLSSDETNFVVDTVQQAQPEVPIISVQVGLLGERPHPASSAVIDAMHGPQAFVGAVKSVTLLRQRAS